MSVIKEVVLRTLYMSIFFVLLPLGAYTIHTGMSAMVAAVTYGILSIVIPICYIRAEGVTFGTGELRISWWAYLLGWLIVQGITVAVLMHVDLTWLWELSTIGRDICFALIMYGQVALALCLGSMFGSRNVKGM